jgi:hypothetical protein
MGKIVPFPSETRRRGLAAPEGSAQILFFLGVRYVRDEDDKGDRPNRRGSGSPSSRPRRKKRA